MSEDKLERNEVQRKMFGYFRESGPPPKGLPKHMYTMAIFHGGYFLEEADGTTKYKIPKFNTNGGKIYLDMLDPEKISWVELNNIAWALGYRELPIAYHFNPPKTPTNMGYVQIKGDGDAVEMVNSIGPKKRQISVYITGGGRRKYAEALVDFEKGVAEGWSNPLNDTRIINSVLLPNAEHRHCVRHLHNNFKQKHRDEIFKQLMWNAARSTTIAWFTKYMDEMKMVKEEAANWFKDKDPSHWSRAYFKEDCKCDTLLNNLCESFNNSILQARDKPILAMLEKIRMDLMVRNANRRVACENWKDVVGPRIKKMLDIIGLGCTNYKVHRVGEYAFQVTCFGENVSQYAVDLGLRTCTCRRWQLSGIPCVHAVSCIRFKKQNASLYCHEYLLCTSYMIAYTPIIHPIAGMDDWEPVDFPIAPPSFNKQPGRPKKKRISSQGENLAPPAPSGGKLSRVGVTMTCKICGQKGHNRLGCPITKAKKVEQQGQGTSGVGNGAEVTTKKRVKTKVQRIPYPPNKLRLVKEQVIRSRKGYKKMKLAMNGGISSESGNGSASTQPPTQSSQNYAPNVASNFT